MRGYFTRLAKQSGLAIGSAGAASAQAKAHLRSSPRASPAAARNVETPLHFESVDLITPSAADPGSPSLTDRGSSFGRGLLNQDAFASGPAMPADINGAQSFRGEVSSFPDSSNQQIAKLSETKLVRQGSSRPSASADNVGEGWAEADGPGGERSEQPWTGQGGVVRVGERRGSNDQRSTLDSASFSEVAPAIGRQNPDFSIPPDYLEDIREWLSSTPNSIEAIRSSEDDSNPGKAFTASKQEVRALVPNLSDRDGSSQKDIQEFSLSIGSISIVVEQPAQAPNDRPASRQPIERQPASAQTGATDTFALSRSYFRGF